MWFVYFVHADVRESLTVFVFVCLNISAIYVVCVYVKKKHLDFQFLLKSNAQKNEMR